MIQRIQKWACEPTTQVQEDTGWTYRFMDKYNSINFEFPAIQMP